LRAFNSFGLPQKAQKTQKGLACVFVIYVPSVANDWRLNKTILLNVG
jgi:hypothetical protein